MGVGGKKRIKEKRKQKEKESDPPSTVGRLLGIDKRVGSWGKKVKESKRKQKRKPLALAQKMYDDSTSRSHEILAIKVKLTLAK